MQSFSINYHLLGAKVLIETARVGRFNRDIQATFCVKSKVFYVKGHTIKLTPNSEVACKTALSQKLYKDKYI